MYLPVRVSTLIFSPVLMNSGACTGDAGFDGDGLLDVVGRIAADAFRRVGHGQDHAGRQFDGHRFVFDERHRHQAVFHEIIFRVADEFRRERDGFVIFRVGENVSPGRPCS